MPYTRFWSPQTQYEFMDLQRGQTEELTSKVDKALADQSVLSDEMMNFNKTLDDINMFIRNVFSKVNSNMRDLEDKFKGVLNKTHEEEFKGEIKQLKVRLMSMSDLLCYIFKYK